MEALLFRQKGMHFCSNWHWHKWPGILLLILLGLLNLIWPIPTLILLSCLLLFLCLSSRPYIALVITILILGFECVTISYVSITSSRLYFYGIFYFIGVLGFLCWCLARLAGIAQPYQSTTLDIPLALFYISGVYALIWSRYLHQGVEVIIFLTMSYCLYLLISALNTTPRHVERFFWLWYILGIITIITTVTTFFIGYSPKYPTRYFLSDNFSLLIYISKFEGTRRTLTGTLGSAKAIACVLNISIFCGLTLLCTRTRRSSRVLILVGLLGMLYIHFMTLSRLEVMGLFFGWLVFAHLNPQWRNSRIWRHVLMVVSVVAVFLAFIATYSIFYDLRELLARSAGQEQTLAGYQFSGTQARLDRIYYLLGEIFETGGWGAGSAGIMQGFDPSTVIHSPNFYFSVLTDHGYGMLSLIFLLWIMINLFVELRWALQNCPDPRYKLFIIGVCSGLITFAAEGIGDHFFYIHEMWVLLGFAVASIKGVRYLLKSSPQPV